MKESLFRKEPVTMSENAKSDKMKELLRVVKYALIAASAGLIQFGSELLLEKVFHLPYWLSYLVALILSVLWNFTINRKYTFKSANNIPVAMLKVAAYYAVFTPLSTTGGNYLVETLHWNSTLVLVATMLINFVTEFLYQRFFVFGQSIDTNAQAQKEREAELESSRQ